jgi:hypothetical protein
MKVNLISFSVFLIPIFLGQYSDGKKNGSGKLMFADGSYYDGEFLANDIHGRGVYVWPDGKKYVGQWGKNKMHGKGSKT